jgi:3-methyladenine DNA glycosylase AlkD
MEDLTLEIQKLFAANKDDEYAKQMSAYMRNKFPFYGLRSPIRKELVKDFQSKKFLLGLPKINLVLRELWELPQREFQYTAGEMIVKLAKERPVDYIAEYEYFITNKSWWDTIDLIVPKGLGEHFKIYPQIIPATVDKWIESENIWLQRASILFQLKYKKEVDLDLLFSIINRLKGSNEFFVQKAIGWVLREYTRYYPEKIVGFVENNELANLSRREALKYLKNKGLL